MDAGMPFVITTVNCPCYFVSPHEMTNCLKVHIKDEAQTALFKEPVRTAQ
jgi:hypothetical protein